MNMIVALFVWFAGVFNDPNDKQGSTKRVCLFLFLGTVMTLIVIVAIAATPMKLPDIPPGLLNLYAITLTVLTGALVADKGIAAYKAVKGGADAEAPPA